MRAFKNRKKNLLYFLYRIISPIFDPLRFYLGVTGYLWFLRDLTIYKIKDPRAKLFNLNLFPTLHDKTKFTPFDSHYFYQQLWVFDNILKRKPKLHIDVGSTYQMSGYISKITKAKFIDIRPAKAKLKNLSIEKGNILGLDLEDNSVESLSCLHVIEHIGLGRYGDRIDPAGPEKAARELSRVLAKGGFLYISTPVGKERIHFNAHRVFNPTAILKYFKNLKPVSFSVVDDAGKFREKVSPAEFKSSTYACGMFLFKKI